MSNRDTTKRCKNLGIHFGIEVVTLLWQLNSEITKRCENVLGKQLDSADLLPPSSIQVELSKVHECMNNPLNMVTAEVFQIQVPYDQSIACLVK